MTKWKLVVFVEGEPSPETIYTPTRTIDSYEGIVRKLAQLDDLADQAWDDIGRIGARYAELMHRTIVLVPC